MAEITAQDQLPLGHDVGQADRGERADIMAAAGIRPPQRYEVIPEDRFSPITPHPNIFLRLVRFVKAQLP